MGFGHWDLSIGVLMLERGVSFGCFRFRTPGFDDTIGCRMGHKEFA